MTKKTEAESQKSTAPPRLTWITYGVRLAGITELLGGMPKTEDLIRGQMASKEIRLKAKVLGRDPESIIAENMVAMGITPGEESGEEKSAEEEERMSCGFRASLEGTLCLGAHQIPSMLIDCATTLKLSVPVRGLKDLLTRGMRVTGISPILLAVLDAEGNPVHEPIGQMEWGSQIQDRMGRRAILRRYNYVMPWLLDFTIAYPNTKIVTEAIWADLWEMAEVQGLGAARPRGYGKFKVEKMEREG